MQRITVIAILQLLLLVAGWCMLAIVLKFHGYPNNNLFLRWMPLAIWLRENGLWLLLITPAWTVASATTELKENRNILSAILTSLGLLAAVGVFILFVVAAFAPFIRPLLIHVDDVQQNDSTEPRAVSSAD
jgi:hypothetical protein